MVGFGESQKRRMMRKSFSSACRTASASVGVPSHAVVGLGSVERGVQRLDHRHVDRVQLVGAIERQERDGAPALRADERLSHAQPSLSRNQADFDCV
jgi:hypothetical protein